MEFFIRIRRALVKDEFTTKINPQNKLQKHRCKMIFLIYQWSFVYHPTSFEPICGWVEKLTRLYPDSMIYDKLMKNCQHALKTVFSPIEG